MLIAAGPYTLDDDINYEPLEALVEVVLAERPDVLILVIRTPQRISRNECCLPKTCTARPVCRLSTSPDRYWRRAQDPRGHV
jgi:hypothetical protein